MKLTDGYAFVGVVATSGNDGTGGPTRLHNWSASFPQSCETVYWEKPYNIFNSLGYDGDAFDHQITGNFLQAGDVIKEKIEHLWNDIGMLKKDIENLELGANGQWTVEQDIRHGVAGLWRGRIDPNELDGEFDSHRIDPSSDSMTNFLQAGGTQGTVVLLQTMREATTDIIVARHKITIKIVKNDPLFTENQSSCFQPIARIHQTAKKQNATENLYGVWAGANLLPPQIPCPP